MLLLLKRCQGAVGPPARVTARWRVASLTCAVAVPGRCCSSEASTSAHSSSGASAPPSPQWSSGPLTVYTHGIETGKYRADPQQARSACRAACAHSLSRQIAQLEAVRKLQRVWDDVKAVGGLAEEEHSSSGLTLVDSLGGSSSWGHSSLWQRLARKLEAPPAPPPPVRGLYLFGARSPLGQPLAAAAGVLTLVLSLRRRRHGQDDANGRLLRLAHARRSQEAHPLPRLYAGRPPPPAPHEERGRPSACCRAGAHACTCGPD